MVWYSTVGYSKVRYGGKVDVLQSGGLMERLDSRGKPRLLRLGPGLPGVRNKDSTTQVSRRRTRSPLMK